MPASTVQPKKPRAPGAKQPVAGPTQQLTELLRPYLGRLLLVLSMLVALTLVNMAVPAVIGILFDDVFPTARTSAPRWALLWSLLPFLLLVYLARNVLYFGSKYTTVTVGEEVCFQLRRRLFQRLQSRNLQFYRNNNPGELSSRVMDDTFSIQTFIQEDLPKLLQAACMFVGLVIVVYVLNWQLALVTTVVLPLHLVVFRYYRKPIKQTSRVAKESLASVHGNLVEKFLGMEVVQGFTAEERENDLFVRAIDTSRVSQLASKKLHVLQKVMADLLIGLGTVALLGIGGYQVMKNSPSPMQPGTFIAYFGFVGMLYPSVSELMGSFAKLVRAGASLDRVREVLHDRQEEQQFTERFRGPVRGHVGMYWVTMRYGTGQAVLKDVNLDIPAGTFCVITGPTGSGKSTLVSLVPRFVSPNHGRVLVDSMELSTADVKRLRESIGIAFQDPFLFNATIMENLRYAKPDAGVEQIQRVAEISGVDELVRRLPDGYDTLLGERGWNLSRGEKQKVALTRALLKEPKILIMDEATASIDGAGANRIISAVQQFMQGRTTLMVTQNPELLKYADMLVLLNKGRLLYQGPPLDLPVEALATLGKTAPIVISDPDRRVVAQERPAFP